MASRIPLNILCGVPDDGNASVHVLDGGRRLEFNMLGTTSITPYLSPERFALTLLYLKQGEGMPLSLGPGALVNHIADADIYSQSLEVMKQVVAKVPRPCFNHPAAIAGTTRDNNARILAGIPGLNVPATVRVDAGTPAEVRKAIDAAGLVYPVLLRVPGSHAGVDLIRADTPDAVDGIAGFKRQTPSLYVTQFQDFVSPDGRYRKFRVAVVGDRIFLRHCIIGSTWLLHAKERGADSHDEEFSHLAAFETKWAPRLHPMFREIARRLDLDYFGVDFNLDEAGTALLFEANACMYLLKNTSPSPNMWDRPVARIRGALEELLAAPKKWRSYNRVANPEAT